ncbi:MAG: DUF167 family protein [Thermofilaceae archaeon]
MKLRLEVTMKPSSQEFKILVEEDEVSIFCREKPIKGRVNMKLVKKLSRLLHTEVSLVSGFTSRQKKLLVKSLGKSKVKHILSHSTGK